MVDELLVVVFYMAPCDCVNGGSVDVLFTWWVWFYLWGADAILGNGYGI